MFFILGLSLQLKSLMVLSNFWRMFDCLRPDLFRLINHPIQSDGLPF